MISGKTVMNYGPFITVTLAQARKNLWSESKLHYPVAVNSKRVSHGRYSFIITKQRFPTHGASVRRRLAAMGVGVVVWASVGVDP